MRNLRSTTFLTPLVLAMLPQVAAAQTTISTATTAPVRTSTGGNISLTADGSITLASGSAVTVDSNNTVTNAGKLVMDGSANGSTAVDVQAGTTGDITSSGTISLLETFNAQNDDGNAIVDGPVASASNRAAVLVRGAHSGNIVNSGKANVDGLSSSGIRIDGTLTGNLTHSGEIAVLGDYSYGIKTGAVTGNVNVLGKVNVLGEGAVAVDIGGDVSGIIRLQNAIGQNVTYVNDAGTTMALSRSDLRVNAPAVSIAGNVGGGIIVDIPPTLSTTNTDVDGDGILDANEASGAIQGFGNGPAIRIGGATATTISAVAGDTHGLVIKGTVLSNAYYSNTDTVALDIGGQGGAVTMAGGLSVSGKVQATTNDSMATAILINAGSSVPVIDNTGSIISTITATGDGAAYGIRDLSGTLTTINSNGFITAAGSTEDITDAIDLSANTTGVTINQYTKADETADQEKAINNAITGNIRTGSGNDLLTVSDGAVKGNIYFGAGNDTLSLSGDATYAGRADFGTGTATMTLANTSIFTGTAIFNDQLATMTIADTARFTGFVTGGSQLNIAVNGGTLEASGTTPMTFNNLTVSATGTLKVAVNGGTTKTNGSFLVNNATFATGASIGATISSLAEAEGTYVVLTSNGTLTGTPTFSTSSTALPVLFKGSVAVDSTAKTVSLTIQRKTASELTLTNNQAAAYNAILAAAAVETQIQSSLLQVSDVAGLKAQFSDMLPEHAGGNFDMLMRGSRMAMRHIANNNAMFTITNLGGWIEPIKWKGSKKTGNADGYNTNGWGISAGIERAMGFGNIGLSFAYLSGKNEGIDDRLITVSGSGYEFGGFWRISKGNFYAFARGTYTIGQFKQSRGFKGTVSSADFFATATSNHNGRMYSGAGGISYQVNLTDRIAVKPMAIIDYYRLKEKGYTETGGSDAINLIVAPRTSTASSATTTVTGIYRMGTRSSEGIPLTFELEGGRRNRLGGKLGNTTAHFLNGADFTVSPETIKDGWLGELRMLSGGLDYTWSIGAGAEQTDGKMSYTARVSFGVAF